MPTIFRELDRAAQIETVRRTFAFELRAHVEMRDWDRAALDRALQTGLGDEYPFVWEGRRRTSRSRRHSAVLRGRFAVDGYARVQVVVREEASGDERTTDEFRCGASAASLTRTDKTFRWVDATRCEFWAGTDVDDTARITIETDGTTSIQDDVLLDVAQPAHGDISTALDVVALPPFVPRSHKKPGSHGRST